MTQKYAILAVALVVVLLGGLGVFVVTGRQTAEDGAKYAACRESNVAFGGKSLGGPITLINQHGATVSDADVFTKPSLVYFGYSFCPDVCPMDVARNVSAVDLLADNGVDVAPVFITIDPARDTPEVLADYAEAMHPKMIALTGSAEQVKAASLAYATYYKKNGEGEDYLMDHSTFTYLVMPDDGFVEFFRRDETPEEISKKIACFAGAS